MDLTVLAVPDCPNVMLLEERLAQVLEGRRDVTVSRRVIADEDDAASRGMHGSPTILVDGIDPFSATATPHTIQITGGASAYAMCAIDALGMAEMLHTSVLIRSTDPSNGEPITVTLDGSSAVWNPATTVATPQLCAIYLHRTVETVRRLG